MVYLDDGIGSVKHTDGPRAASDLVMKTLVQVGFVVQPEKCNWDPSL